MALSTDRHSFTVADYHRMAEAGILAEDARVELLDGEITDMAPIGRRHQAGVDRLADWFFRRVGDQAIVRVQGSVVLSELSEPQPDLVLLRRRADFYRSADAGPEDVLLLVEVADSSLAHDRDVKMPLYARAGIPEVWLVNLVGNSVTQYREPTPDGFGDVRTVQGHEPLTPLAFPLVTLNAAEILG